MGFPSATTPARDGRVWRKWNAKQSPDGFVQPFGEQLKGQRWGMVVLWHEGSYSFCSGGDVSDLNQLPAAQETTLTRKGLTAELREAWEGLQLRNMPHSVRNSRGSSGTGSCLSFATSKIKWSDLFLSACDGHPSILLFSIIFSFRFIIRAISDH